MAVPAYSDGTSHPSNLALRDQLAPVFDALDGGPGIDAAAGGAGDDLYLVNLATDTVLEVAGKGDADSVRAWTRWTLGDAVEHLTLAGKATLS